MGRYTRLLLIGVIILQPVFVSVQPVHAGFGEADVEAPRATNDKGSVQTRNPSNNTTYGRCNTVELSPKNVERTWDDSWNNDSGKREFVCFEKLKGFSGYAYFSTSEVVRTSDAIYFVATKYWNRIFQYTSRKSPTTIYRLDRATGEITNVTSTNGLIDDLAIQGNIIYGSTADGLVFGLNRRTGEIDWRLNLTSHLSIENPGPYRFRIELPQAEKAGVYARIRIYQPEPDRELITEKALVISPNGEITLRLTGDKVGKVVDTNLAKHRITVLGDDALKGVNPYSGETVWRIPEIHSGAIRITDDLANNTISYLTDSGLYRVNIRSGEVIWYNPNVRRGAIQVNSITSNIFRYDGTIYFIDWETGEAYRTFTAKKWCSYQIEGRTSEGNYVVTFGKPVNPADCDGAERGGTTGGALIQLEKLGIRVYSPAGEVVNEWIYNPSDKSKYLAKKNELAAKAFHPQSIYFGPTGDDSRSGRKVALDGYRVITQRTSLVEGWIRGIATEREIVYNESFQKTDFYLYGTKDSSAVYAIRRFEEHRENYAQHTILYRITIRENSPPQFGEITDRIVIDANQRNKVELEIPVSDADGHQPPIKSVEWSITKPDGSKVTGAGTKARFFLAETGVLKVKVTATDPLGAKKMKKYTIPIKVTSTSTENTEKDTESRKESGTSVPGFGLGPALAAIMLVGGLLAVGTETRVL